jgi:hypothetical protein
VPTYLRRRTEPRPSGSGCPTPFQHLLVPARYEISFAPKKFRIEAHGTTVVRANLRRAFSIFSPRSSMSSSLDGDMPALLAHVKVGTSSGSNPLTLHRSGGVHHHQSKFVRSNHIHHRRGHRGGFHLRRCIVHATPDGTIDGSRAGRSTIGRRLPTRLPTCPAFLRELRHIRYAIKTSCLPDRERRPACDHSQECA